VLPTVHIFASPPSAGENSPPHVILLPLESNATNEPALLLISPSGSIRFWSSIFLGLAGADRFVQHVIALTGRGRDGETITRAQPLIPALSLSSNNAAMQGKGAHSRSMCTQANVPINSDYRPRYYRGNLERAHLQDCSLPQS
jgi:hypothetical protein